MLAMAHWSLVEDSAAPSRRLERSERSLGKLLGGQLNRSGMTWRSPALQLNCAVIQMQQAGRLTTVPCGPTSSESVSSNLKHSIDTWHSFVRILSRSLMVDILRFWLMPSVLMRCNNVQHLFWKIDLSGSLPDSAGEIWSFFFELKIRYQGAPMSLWRDA